MNVLVLGSTGMLGQSLMSYLKSQKIHVEGVARSNADYNIDVANDLAMLKNVINEKRYDVVINTIALVNLNYCEQNPTVAYVVNTYVTGEVAKICNDLNIYFIQISTDHYYIGDTNLLHRENQEIVLLNEYAKTKYLAEKLVELYSNTLIVRTNIVGYRNSGSLTFVEWFIDALIKDEQITGYVDMYTSSIDVESLSEILYLLIKANATGLLNVSADGVLSKFDFIYQFAQKIGKEHLIQKGHLEHTIVKRGDSLGLSVDKLKLKYPHIEVPTVEQVIKRLYVQYLKF